MTARFLEQPGRMAPLSRGLAQTKSASTRNCWRATGATWLLLPWRRVADGSEALELVESQAAARVWEAQPILRRSAHFAWARRWGRMLSISCARSFCPICSTCSADQLNGGRGRCPRQRVFGFHARLTFNSVSLRKKGFQ